MRKILSKVFALRTWRVAPFIIPMLCCGCAKNMGGDFCLIYIPIHADYVLDTKETLRQIDLNNAAHDALC